MRAKEFTKSTINESNHMDADQVLHYVKKTHAPEPFNIEYSITDHPAWELKNIPLSQLNLDPNGEVQDPYNRTNWVDYDVVRDLIPKIAQVLKSKPIVVDADGWIIDGNHRAMAAAEAGLTSVPALVPAEVKDITEARRNPKQNVKFQSGKFELVAAAENIRDKRNWGVSMTAEPKLGINPQVGISEDTPKGIYFYPLEYFIDTARRYESLPWGDNMPYMQLFQYDRSGEMTQQTQVDPAQLRQALSQYCPEEVIQQVLDEPDSLYDDTPYWFIYDCLSRLGKSDETNIIRWNKVLRDLGFTSVFDPGRGWIAYGEPTQGVILDPRIIKQHRMFVNRDPTGLNWRYDINRLVDAMNYSDYYNNELQKQQVPYGHPDRQKTMSAVANTMLKPFLGKTKEEAKEMGLDQALKTASDKVIEILKQDAVQEGVAEAFDKPHKTKLNELFTSYGGYELHHNPRNTDRGYIYYFNTKDKRDGEIIIKPKHLKQGVDSVVFVEFNIDGSTDTSGKGDAIMIFSTVLKAANSFAREHKPQYIVFETEDPEKLKLYQRLVKYFVGYKPVDWTKDNVLNRQIGPELSGFADEAIVLQRQDNADSIKPQSPAQGLYVIYGRGKYAGQVWHRFDLDSTVTPVGRYTRDGQAEKFAEEWVEKNGKRLGNQNMNYLYDWNLAKDPSGLEFGPAPAGQYSQVSQQDIEYIAWYLSQQQNLDQQSVAEAFNQPYKTKTEKSDYGDVDMLAKLPDGTNLSIMFNHEGDNEWQVEFYRDNSQEITGQGDAQRIFATVLASIQKFVKKYQPDVIKFSAEKSNSSDSRSSLYDRLVARFAQQLGYNDYSEEYMGTTMYELSKQPQGMAENFADGKNPGRKGLSKRMGVNTKASVSSLRNTAKHSTGEKARMAHWLANMKAGRAKAKKK